MFTPQQIEQVSFSRTTFGGYDIQSVDAFLEPLTNDYITLHKENALLKSKMKVLVNKLEEYRNSEASLQEAIAATQETCDRMVKETEEKCAQMLADASEAAKETANNADSLIASENARVDAARQAACDSIELLKEQIQACLATLENIKNANLPTTPVAYDFAENTSADDSHTDADDVADEISANLQALMGEMDDSKPAAEAKNSNPDMAAKFANLQFGRNYDPSKH